ncbi:hypothetical protein A3A95_01840 [Candidatus Nomurabacteria bacterium RIFCSPLOWO2_01_FULL_39_18]|uniref:Uncharacterized protein n=1 Tax=Candidatus Nomurabacteria bacterium RIFCSPHIGHO2_01_FULL_40_24b TaxID=1801739 RepID=A0A1F6V9F2_9BACT|nr:MAG: hypothetical protein A2647_00880 [Candidatus Nomurabacteria bacterium RIFCSPHIGHO2_01_FULL_40_24b]OGI90606.1 MAG: hypothetical protein A3A95_01840 [Candidatus Nomurabacteria bacterium RIFCSPLOWO2_01_FULL_39_18]
MKNNQKGFASLVLIGVLVVLVAIGGYFAVSKKPNNQQTSDVSTPIPEDWKTYTNELYGFEFKYPEDLYFQENPPYVGESGTQPSDDGSIRFIRPDSSVPFSNMEIFKITFFPKGIVSDDYNWPERPCGEWTFGESGGPESITHSYFLGHKSLEVVTVIESSPRIADNYICVNYPKEPFVILSNEKYKNEVNQILSTFKFIEPTTQTDTSNWEMYTNAQYGFEIKYPTQLLTLVTKNGFMITNPIGTNYETLDSSSKVDLTVSYFLSIKDVHTISIDGANANNLKDLTKNLMAPEKTILGGEEAYIGGFNFPEVAGLQIVALKNGHFYVIDIITGEDLEVSKLEKDIISTFKFTK